MLIAPTLLRIKIMDIVGRNDPCPCGSGKKYKKCCGTATVISPDFAYDRIRRLDGLSGDFLTKFARQRCGEESLEDAWEQFIVEEDIPFDKSHPEMDLFLRWFTLDWRPEEKETLPELFLSQKGSQVDGDLRRFIEVTIASPYSFYQTIEVDPGKGLTLRDILRKRELRITERSASRILERGHILFARVVEMDGVIFMMGCGAQPIPARFLDYVLNIRENLGKDAPSADVNLSTDALLIAQNELRERYFMIAAEITKVMTDIRNTDGDPLALHKLTYSIPSIDDAFRALKDLEQMATKVSDEEMLAMAERDSKGKLTKAYIHWLKRGTNDMGGNTALGSLTLSNSRLVIEVNSEKRSKRIQKEIRKRLADDAVLLRTEITSAEGILNKSAREKKEKKEYQESEHDRLMRESPEARNFINGILEKHWSAWPDTPVPALRGMTPRQAAKDPKGRELLESLLMDFELQNRQRDDIPLHIDVTKLRRELRLGPG